MEPYQMAATVFGAAMLLLTTRELLRKRMRLLQYSFWLVLWLALILIGTAPQFYSTLLFATQALGMYTPIHFVTTFSVLILFAATYLIEKRIGELNEKINRIIQHIALLNADKETSGPKKKD
jgi:hypothetical protein